MFNFLNNAPPAVKKVLIKLAGMACLLACLTALCYADIDRSLVAVIAATTAIAVLPVTLVLTIDASRVIRNMMPLDKKAKIFATVLAIPQIVLGLALLLIGLVYPFVLMNDVIKDIRAGQPIFLPIVSIFTAVFMFIIGYYYILEGIGLRKYRDQSVNSDMPKKKVSTFRRRL